MTNGLTNEDRKIWELVAKTISPLGSPRQPTQRADRVIIATKIDLHGYTFDDAYETVYEYLRVCKENQLKEVIIVTGIGPAEPANSICREFPMWMETQKFSKYIRSFVAEHNSGSWRIKINR